MMILSRRNGRLSSVVAAFVGCVIIGDISPGLCGWPEGTYGIPASKDLCPSNSGVYRWKLGSVLQKTEYGSHTSGNVNLYGMTDGPMDRICQTFCMKTSYSSDKKHHFMPGKYCIFKLNQCPARFQEGWIYWDDAAPWFAPTIQNSSGVLPDGDYARNTRIEYCCRYDGDTSDEIVLPTSDPFYLLKYGDLCQEVVDMNVVEEWVYWAGEKSVNLDDERGVHPRVERQKFPKTYTKLFYCYYTPKPPATLDLSKGSGVFETFLMVLCIIGATLGVIFFIAVILATIQKALMIRKQRRQRLQQQNQQLPTNFRSERIAENRPNAKANPKPSRGNDLPAYSSCIAPAGGSSIRLEKMKDSVGRKAPVQTTASLDDLSSVDSISLQQDADNLAPPSYDEVLRDGNLNFIV